MIGLMVPSAFAENQIIITGDMNPVINWLHDVELVYTVEVLGDFEYNYRTG